MADGAPGDNTVWGERAFRRIWRVGPERPIRRQVSNHRPLHFGPVEAVLIGLLGTALGVIAVATAVPWLLTERHLVPEADTLRAAYGPDKYSHHDEEWIIRDFFKDKRGGFFLDVGAHHYRQGSNTYYLEAALEWEGIAVEPLVEFEAEYVQFRPRTRFRAFFASDVSDDRALLYTLPNRLPVSSGVERFTRRYGDDVDNEAVEARDVPTITLNDLLAAEGVERIDLLSMDIELWEPKALAGFDVRRFRPSLVCIEAHPEVRQQILDYFAAHHYVAIGRYLRADVWNLYFAPLAAPVESPRRP